MAAWTSIEVMTTLIRRDGAVVAVAGPVHYYLAPDVARRSRGDRQRRIVALMCSYAHAVQTGRLPGPYTDGRAESYAICALDLLDGG